MNYCEKCFRDTEIRAIIAGSKVKGNCNFCKNNDVFICDPESNDEISDLFNGLLDIFSVEASLPENYPKEALNSLKNFLAIKWEIFAVDEDTTNSLLKAISKERYKEQPELFHTPVGISELYDQDYLQQYSIIKTYSWNNFVTDIKHVNRFHTHHINTDTLFDFLASIEKTYPAGKTFFRARICSDTKGIPKEEMGAPKKEKAMAGRANSEGVPCLYLSDSKETTLHEIRAGVYDYITVGEFKLLKKIEIIDLAAIDKIGPFRGMDYTQFAVNIEHLKLIGNEIAKPLRRYDSYLDYLPTQYVSDYIKSFKYDGIEYISTMCPDGYNIALFDENVCECIDVEVYDVESLKYEYKQV